MDDAANMPANILLVDDEEMVRNLLNRALTADGHAVSLAANQQEAFGLLGDLSYDLMIVDKNLPDGSGLSVIEGARNMSIDAEAIVITGYSDTDSAIRAVSLGVFRYVRKPFDLDALRVDINRALETGRLRRTLSSRTRELERSNTDLREAMEREKEAENRRVRAERLAMIGSLAAGVAHEINNPLALLSMTIPYTINELDSHLKSNTIELDPERATESLGRLAKSLVTSQEAVELLLSLSSDLHSMGRKDTGVPRPVNLAESANSAMRLVRHQLKNKASVVVDVPEELVVSGFSRRLVQVFINLLTNASRAIMEGDLENNEVAIRAERKDGGDIVVSVSDTGAGIPKANLEKIFQRFFSSSVPGEAHQGSGIGLSIVREIMDEHKGSVEVESEVGEGTTFKLFFPVEVDRQPILSIPAVARRDQGHMIRTRRNILFVDSVEGSLEAYEASFGQMHDVHLARTPEEALTLLEDCNQDLDAIVCELGDGEHPMWKLYETVASRYQEMQSRFIFLGVPGEDSQHASTSGIQVLHKPVRPAVLLASIYSLPPRPPSGEQPGAVSKKE